MGASLLLSGVPRRRARGLSASSACAASPGCAIRGRVLLGCGIRARPWLPACRHVARIRRLRGTPLATGSRVCRFPTDVNGCCRAPRARAFPAREKKKQPTSRFFSGLVHGKREGGAEFDGRLSAGSRSKKPGRQAPRAQRRLLSGAISREHLALPISMRGRDGTPSAQPHTRTSHKAGTGLCDQPSRRVHPSPCACAHASRPHLAATNSNTNGALSAAADGLILARRHQKLQQKPHPPTHTHSSQRARKLCWNAQTLPRRRASRPTSPRTRPPRGAFWLVRRHARPACACRLWHGVARGRAPDIDGAGGPRRDVRGGATSHCTRSCGPR